MRNFRKQKSSFKKTLAFCIIVAIIATIIHLNGAKADTTTTVDADVNITKVDNGYLVEVTFNQINVGDKTVEGWSHPEQNKFTKTYTKDMDHTSRIRFTKTITANGETRDMWLPVMDGANRTLKLNSYTIKNITLDMLLGDQYLVK